MSLIDRFRVEPGKTAGLSKRDPAETAGVDHAEADDRLAANVEAIDALQQRLYAEHTRALLVVLQAMDAAGKDSTIRHVFGPLNPQGVQVKAFKKPTPDELAHDFLWRVHQATPRRGHIAIFNRSHYEDVLVVRVDKLVPESVWRDRYDQINGFERLLCEAGTKVVKIHLLISPERQREKLMRRITDPRRNWKFEAEDFETRKKWGAYREAYEEAITRTSTKHAPWYVVPTDKKWFRLLVVSEIIRAELEAMKPEFPALKIEPAAAMKLLEELNESSP
ncbi:MAG: polyphosphate kinase 2 family protein [Phycisphaerales bacterium]